MINVYRMCLANYKLQATGLQLITLAFSVSKL